MLSHLGSNYLRLQHSVLGQPFRYGQEGVLIFFLLSGFVIYYSWHEFTGTKNFATFFYKRFKRIYPLFILSLGIAYFVVFWRHGLVPVDFRNLFGNLFMVQGFDTDRGWKATPYMDNNPLWSLSYEWWFYMMFYPIYRFVPSLWHKMFVVLIGFAGMAGEVKLPNIFFHILASFPLWWCGVEFAREYLETGNITIRRQLLTIGMLVVSALGYIIVANHWLHRGGLLTPIRFPVVKLRHYGVAILLVMIFFAWKRIRFKGFACTFGPFEIFAGMSYGLYVIHYPIICDLRIIHGRSWLFLGNVVCKVGLVLLLAYLAEEVLQKRLNRWMDSWFKRHIRPASRDREPQASI